MIDVITISSKGQIVIPKKIREEAGLAEQDKLVVVSDKDQIILKKVSKEKAKKKLLELIDEIGKRFKDSGITEEDIQKEIEAVRNEKTKNRA
ncbi:MAG: AbrB/MazE/SpoVT family DNA-binding domain-containing protein [Nanoarchaeota archaeon]|nr:AbrB/MazE/SpoVT family DNA-binding domain-containing protein [Nanoarchaeota archaeon]